MTRWIVESSMKLRYLVIILALMLLVFGILQLRQMPVSVYPEVDPPYVEVQTEALGLSAEEVEAFITVPMEADLLNGVAWLDQIYSESVNGLSSILLIFEPGTDPIRARQMVQERLTQAHALPNVSQPPVMLQPLSSTNRALMVGLSSDELSPIDMGVLSRWIIKPRLLGVPGVANVAIWGQRERQLQVLVNPRQLHEQGVTLDQVIETAGEALWVSPLSFLEASSPGTAGWIDTPNQRLSVRHILPISTAEDLAKVTVVDNEPLLLGDVATVVEDHQPLIGDAALKDGPGFLLVIEKFPGANTLEVTRGVEEALTALQPGLQGMEIDTTMFRPATFIETASANLGTLLLISLVLVALILLAFYFEWRKTLISLIAIPLSLIAAGMTLYLTGATFNLMIFAGMVAALGLIVDNAIVDVDNIGRRLRQHSEKGGGEPVMDVILASILEIRGSLGFAMLIILLAILPIFFLPGLLGSFVEPLAMSYVLAMISSLLVALIVTPALSVSLLSSGSTRRESPITNRMKRIYSNILARTVQSSRAAVIVAGVLLVVGLVTLFSINAPALPSLKQTDMLIQFEAAPGTSRVEMNRIMAQANQELQAIAGVHNVGSHVGRAITGDAVVSVNAGEFWVSIDPAADYQMTIAAIQDVVDGFPGLNRRIRTYQPEPVEETVAGPDKDIVVRIYGHELDVLNDMAQEVTLSLAEVDGIVDAEAEIYNQKPQVEIEVDLAAAEKHGVKPGDIRRQATTLLSGIHVGNLFEEQKVFDVVVWGAPELRNNLTSIRELLIDTPTGGQVVLGEVADVRIAPSATVIQRDAVSRYIDIGANVSGRPFTAVSADINSLLYQIEVPFEYHMEILSDSQQTQIDQQRLIAIVAAAVVGIFLLLHASIENWRMALVVFLTLPIALVGGLVAAVISGSSLSVGALFGLFTVLGISVSNSLLLVHNYRRLERTEGQEFGLGLILRGSQERIVPILITAMVMTVALVPFLVGGGLAGNELAAPMAGVILGGLITTTLVNLFIVPSLILRYGFSSVEEQLPVMVEEGVPA